MRNPSSRLIYVCLLGIPLLFGLHTLVVQAESDSKVTLCHIPPDDPENYATIDVSESAVQSHLDHDDLLGACLSHCEALSDDGNACTEDFGVAFNGSCFASYTEVQCEEGKVCDPSDGECFVPLDIETLHPVDLQTLSPVGTPTLHPVGTQGGCGPEPPWPDDDPYVTAVCIGSTWCFRRNI